MNIIWTQVITQILGFLLAFFILKRFAWGPILKMLDERREKIRADFDRIEATREEVAALKADYEGQLRNLEAQARLRIQEAVQEGQKVAVEIREQARLESRELVIRAREEIAREHDKARVGLRNDIARMVTQVAERLLKEKLDDQAHQKRISEFIDALEKVGERGQAAR